MGDHYREMLISKFRQYFKSLTSFRTWAAGCRSSLSQNETLDKQCCAVEF
jgi:hypothetical protein